MRRKTSEVAASRSNASSRSWRRRVNSLSWPTAEELPRCNGGAVPRFGIAALRRRALACLPLPLERRVMAPPQGSELWPVGLRWRDYIRDLRQAKWGPGINLHSSNSEPLMSAFGHPYSITSSARASSEGGTVRPSILAAWALMTSSNLLACTTGKSAGFAPLSIRPAYTPAWRWASDRLEP